MEGEYETIPKLSNGYIFSDLSDPHFKVTMIFNVK